MIRPAFLQPGDTITIVSPAKAIESEHILFAKEFFEGKGFNVIIGEHAFGTHNYFSSTDAERLHDLQQAVNNPEVKAIICARGGYGCIRITNAVQWASLLRKPKWIAGFSDVTVFHLQALKLGVESIHATMPLNYRENSAEALESLLTALSAGTVQHTWGNTAANKPGEASGELIGGNLSILYSLLATPLRPDFEGKILFIEEVGEQLYHLDRMLQTMKMNGVFEQISGLIIGGMTDMRETAVPTNWTVEELVLDTLAYRRIPVAFNAPIGHINDNRAVIVGAAAKLEVAAGFVKLIQ